MKHFIVNYNARTATVDLLVEANKLHYIQGLTMTCSCGEPLVKHGSRYNTKKERFENYCPSDKIIVDKNGNIVSSMKAEDFNSLFTEDKSNLLPNIVDNLITKFPQLHTNEAQEMALEIIKTIWESK